MKRRMVPSCSVLLYGQAAWILALEVFRKPPKFLPLGMRLSGSPELDLTQPLREPEAVVLVRQLVLRLLTRQQLSSGRRSGRREPKVSKQGSGGTGRLRYSGAKPI